MTRHRLLTLGQAADELAVSITTIRRLVRAGAFPVVTIGARSTRIRQADVDRYVAEHTTRRSATGGRVEAAGVNLAPGERLWD